MSFSSSIKDELSRIQNEQSCCKLAEIAGILRTGLMLRSFKGEKMLLFVTEHAPLSRALYTHIKGIIKKTPEVRGEKTAKLKKHVVYRLIFRKTQESKESKAFFESIGIFVDPSEEKIVYAPFDMKERCCRRAFLRGGFLASGSMTSPDKSYHLEISFLSEKMAEEYIAVMAGFDLKPRQIVRKGAVIVYLKEGQDIVDFLNVIGAHHALMEMENVRILKDMRNQVNRIVNCETANLGKTVNASVKQVEYIQHIENTLGLENLTPGLKEIARLRLENPEISLSELGQMLSPPLSKSGVNHRLRKLEKIALDKTRDRKNSF